jgi:hypothetical protein
MTKIRFKVPHGLSGRLLGRIPVDIVDGSFDLRSQGTLEDGIEITKRGLYGAIATLPNGLQLKAAFEIEEAGTPERIVEFKSPQAATAAARELAPSREKGSAHDIVGLTADSHGSTEEAIDDTNREGRLGNLTNDVFWWDVARHSSANGAAGWWRVIAWNPLIRNPPKVLIAPRRTSELPKGGYAAELSGRAETQFVQVYSTGVPPLNVAVPVAPGHQVDIILLGGHNQLPVPHVQFPDPDMELLLQFSGAGSFDGVKKVAQNAPFVARALLLNKAEDPVSAVVAAYYFLRIGDESIPESWLQRLLQLAPWLPDAHVVLAEHLARSGEHGLAAQSLLQLNRVGLPLFSCGLSYATDRLAQYDVALRGTSRTTEKSASSALGTLRRAALPNDVHALLVKLRGICAQTNFRRPVLSFMSQKSLASADQASQTRTQ